MIFKAFLGFSKLLRKMYVIKKEFHHFLSINNFKNRASFMSESSYSVSDPAPISQKNFQIRLGT
jgi:hypothetical protein